MCQWLSLGKTRAFSGDCGGRFESCSGSHKINGLLRSHSIETCLKIGCVVTLSSRHIGAKRSKAIVREIRVVATPANVVAASVRTMVGLARPDALTGFCCVRVFVFVTTATNQDQWPGPRPA